MAEFEKYFEIDHPLDPENRYLRHSFVESPDRLNIYNGRRGRIFEQELARARAMLPADLSQQVEERLQAILGGGNIDRDGLRRFVAECIRRADIPRAPRRTSRTRLHREWHDVEERVQKALRRDASQPGA